MRFAAILAASDDHLLTRIRRVSKILESGGDIDGMKGLELLKACEAEILKLRVEPQFSDVGPWSVWENGAGVISDDFKRDVVLKISGDFGDDSQRRRYAEELAKRLNWNIYKDEVA